MSTTIKNNSRRNAQKNNSTKTTAKNRQAVKAETIVPQISGELQKVPADTIDFSPFNRKMFSPEAMQEFAAELLLHGIINPLTVREITAGKYELVAGERRLRAARIAGFTEVPVIIRNLTDEEVIELQLSENLQRENPHPMELAQAIGLMKKTGKGVEEIAGRLGKSKQFVYSRAKLLDLTEQVQEMFIADAINLNQALEIASLSAASQTELFGQHWHNWKEVQQFNVGNLNYMLSRYRYDLKKAPFDTKDKKLVPDAGACTHCPFNSATLKTLFPELAAQAVCTKKNCYQSKCDAQFIKVVNTAIRQQQPEAVILDWSFPDALVPALQAIPVIGELKQYKRNDISIMEAPEMPDKKDFMIVEDDDAEADEEADFYDESDDEEPEDTDFYKDGEQPGNVSAAEKVFDEASYNAALTEYYEDLEEYNRKVENGELPHGLLVSATEAKIVLYSIRPVYQSSKAEKGITAKEVQEAIKAGKATPELLQAEIERMNGREQRAKELDGEKVHVIVHSTFMERTKDVADVAGLTAADLVAARLLVYQSLDYSAKNKVVTALFRDNQEENGQCLSLYEQLQKLTEQQYCYLIRMAIGSKSDAKYPNNETGKILYKVAAEAGVEVSRIEQQQQEKADERADKLKPRIAELEKKIDKLKAKAGLAI